MVGVTRGAGAQRVKFLSTKHEYCITQGLTESSAGGEGRKREVRESFTVTLCQEKRYQAASVLTEHPPLYRLIEKPDTKPKGCAGCNRKIKDRYLLKALDKYWHEDCLKCACCDCRLGEVGSTLYTKANLILCRRDYLRSALSGLTDTHIFLTPYDLR
ncbi:hypothetical protein NN561_010965 [Cricetulus griseus]